MFATDGRLKLAVLVIGMSFWAECEAQAYWTPAIEECHNFELLDLTDVERDVIRIITRDWRSKRPQDAIPTSYGLDVGFAHLRIRDESEMDRLNLELGDWERWGYSRAGQAYQVEIWRGRLAHTRRLARRAGCRGRCEARVLAYANSAPREVEAIAARVGWSSDSIGRAWYKARPTGHRWRRWVRAGEL